MTIKSKMLVFLCVGAISVGVYSCKKGGQSSDSTPPQISNDAMASIQKLGFSTQNVQKQDGGYLVEGDIFLTEAQLQEQSTSPNLLIANTEQYRTTNLVTGLPRTVTVSISNLPQAFVSGTDTAIARYNALNLRLKFTRVASGGQIQIIGFNQGPSGGYITLGSSGFPTSNGNPYGQIKMNTNQYAYGSNPNVLYVGSVIAHEMGHCIGFRHTDYMNRAYSCGGTAVNEGASNIGAIQIPGTPSGPDANSWMLACSNGGNRVFNANDKVALNYLYH